MQEMKIDKSKGEMHWQGETLSFRKMNSHQWKILWKGESYLMQLARGPRGEQWVKINALDYFFEGRGRKRTSHETGAEEGEATAPMPGKVLRVLKNDKDKVESNESVLILEAMKMELPIKAQKSGKLKLEVKAGQQVSIGDRLFVVE